MPCTSDGYPSTPPGPRSPSKREKELKFELDKVTRLLCGVLRAADNEVNGSGCLLDEETRAWWIQHQKIDAERLERVRQDALRKLTPEELEVLGLAVNRPRR